MAPIGQITLEVAFGTPHNYRCELLSFEVVPFSGGYDAVLGRTSVFAKFMAIPCYAYMKLKMPGPYGVITVNGNALHALQAEAINLEEADAHITHASRGMGQATAAGALPAQETRLPRYDWGGCPQNTGQLEGRAHIGKCSDPQSTLEIGEEEEIAEPSTTHLS